ncbi:MAG: HEAT repeat domain-containing protein [Thiotrichales bacterium]
MDKTQTPDALMLLGTRCPHCPSVLQGLADLVKQGRIRRLEVVNLDQAPEVAAALGVRSVPWVRLGPFELTGLHSPEELRRWAERAESEAGWAQWCAERLNEGALPRVLERVREDERWLDALIWLLGDADTSVNVRIGIGAVIEDLAGTEMLRARGDRLGALVEHENPTVRADAAHFLGFVGSAEVAPRLERLLRDPDPNVREIAAESLARFASDLT